MGYFNIIGYKNLGDFILRLVLPVMGTSIVFFLGALFFAGDLLPAFFPYVILVIGFIFTAAYPVVMHERVKVDIHENIHLFITYAGTISTLDIDRTTFFKKIAAKKEYGFISKSSQKILYLAKSWNLGFAYSCRKVAKLSPSKIYADFLDRFAAIMDFGGDLGTFMVDEQDAMLADYASEYRTSLNNINMLREVFGALTIAMAFGISAALLLPLIMGISMVVVIRWSLLIIVVVDIFLIVLVKSFIPGDELISKLKHKDDGVKLIRKSLLIISPICLLIGFILFYFNWFPFLFNIAITITPFVLTGYFATKEETAVFERDKAYPNFVRALGTAINARQGGVGSSLKALRVHDFGVLNNMAINLDRRLRIQSDKMKSWYFFSVETGSNLISYFTAIFADSVYNGGNAEKIGEIISRNFNKLIALRVERKQLASALRGALYGGLIGFIATIFIAVSISDVLFTMFNGAFESTNSGASSSLAASIIPQVPPVDLAELGIYIGILVVVHSFISAMLIKLVDGGHKMAFFFDFTLMVWLGAVLSWAIPLVISSMLATPA
jgi:flagellar protein FlaJ